MPSGVTPSILVRIKRVERFLVTARWIRIVMLLGLSALLILMALRSIAGAQPSPVETEHRFTQVETRVEAMGQDIRDIKKTVDDVGRTTWMQLLALAGLIGERGISVMRKKSGGE